MSLGVILLKLIWEFSLLIIIVVLYGLKFKFWAIIIFLGNLFDLLVNYIGSLRGILF